MTRPPQLMAEGAQARVDAAAVPRKRERTDGQVAGARHTHTLSPLPPFATRCSNSGARRTIADLTHPAAAPIPKNWEGPDRPPAGKIGMALNIAVTDGAGDEWIRWSGFSRRGCRGFVVVFVI